MKTCAHCGSKPNIGKGQGYAFVCCPDCLLSNDMICSSALLNVQDAVEDWNTRPREQALLSTLKQAKEALEKCGMHIKALDHPKYDTEQRRDLILEAVNAAISAIEKQENLKPKSRDTSSIT